MDIVKNAKGILLSPYKEWHAIKNESVSISDIITRYAMPIALLPVIAGIIRMSVEGFPLYAAVRWGVLSYALNMGGVFLIAYMLDSLAPSFGSAKNMNASIKTVAFSLTPYWLGGIFTGIYIISIISLLAGIYSLYLFYLGIQIVKETPQEKTFGYYLVSLLLAVAVFIVINAIARGTYL
ncbi:MAG TPA: Yip1 family protein [Ignavibacteriales bacterium]|nr:Yip1 family protein [Ignavibacteriales bacterium]HEX3073054.1 Yip1 family protein [Ignavibacteriales bacterium]